MNTNSAARPHARIGLIETPELGALLQHAGFEVVTGADFRSSAMTIRSAIQSSDGFPLVVADVPAPGLGSYIDRIAKSYGVPIVILRNTEAPTIKSNSAIEVPIPATLDEILEAAGLPPIGGADGGIFYPLGVDLPEEDEEDWDKWEEDPETTQIPHVQQDPEPSQRRQQPDEDDYQEDPAPARQRRQQPPPAEDGRWDTPVQQQPVQAEDNWNDPVQETLEPANQQEEEDWNTPAQENPVQQRRQPPPVQDEGDWDTPMQTPAPAEEDWNEPAPAQQRQRRQPPPVQDEGEWGTPAPRRRQPAQDDWNEPAQEAPAPVQQRRQPPPAQDDWSAPAPVQQRRQPPPVNDDDWDAPAPPQRQQPAQDDWSAPAPVQQRRQPPPVNDDDWDAPAPSQRQQPAQDDWSAPAPVQQRRQPPVEEYQEPAQPQYDEWVAPTPMTAPVHQWAAPEASQEWEAPVQAPVPVPRQQQAPIPEARDAAGIFDTMTEKSLAGTGRGIDGRGQLIINFSGKGGVGKSTTTINIARMAAKHGKRVIVIDGNSGQGDLRTYLRLSQTDLPTIYDAATTGDPRRAILTPAVMNQARNPNLGAIEFGFVAAPPDDLNDIDIVTNSVYSKLIEYCRTEADIVVLDTQIIESADKTGVVTSVILPALVGGAWGIGVADMSNPGVNSLQSRLRKFNREGAATARFMILFNRVEQDEIETAERASQLFRGQGTYLGAITVDPAIKDAMNSGRIDPGSEAIDRAMATALYRITDDPKFQEVAERELVTVGAKRVGFFSRLLGKGKKK